MKCRKKYGKQSIRFMYWIKKTCSFTAMLRKGATLLKMFGMLPHAPVFQWSTPYTPVYSPHERNDRCKFKRRLVELRKKALVKAMEHIMMSTKEQNTFSALKKIKLHYEPSDVPPESDLPLTKDIP